MDLTMTSSDVEEEVDYSVVSEAESPPRRFRKHALDKNDDDDYFEDMPGWVQKIKRVLRLSEKAVRV